MPESYNFTLFNALTDAIKAIDEPPPIGVVSLCFQHFGEGFIFLRGDFACRKKNIQLFGHPLGLAFFNHTFQRSAKQGSHLLGQAQF